MSDNTDLEPGDGMDVTPVNLNEEEVQVETEVSIHIYHFITYTLIDLNFNWDPNYAFLAYAVNHFRSFT